MEKQKIFMIQLDWSTDDDKDVEIYLFQKYEDAKQKFIELVEHEKDPNISWVYQAFDGSYDEEERFELETNLDDDNAYELYWDITDTWDYAYRTHIQLREMEVQ